MILWIKALADDVVVDLGQGDVIEPPLGDLPVAAAVDVHDDLRRRIARTGLDASNAGSEKARAVVPDLALIVGLEIPTADLLVCFLLHIGIRDMQMSKRPQ